MEPTFRSPFSYGISNSGKRLPRNGLLLYLARPNSDEYLVGEDTYIWGYILPDDADIRAATGWVSGTANVFYGTGGTPIVALATEIAQAVLPANVVFSLVDATTQTGKLAVYTTTTTAATLAKARSVLRDESINYLFYGRTAIVYDPQDLTTMYQDAAGTLPVYRPGSGSVDPPVGLLLDKSQGLELGPELFTNGDFSNGDTGLTLHSSVSVVGGRAVFDGVTIVMTTDLIVASGVPSVAGAWYKCTYTITEHTTSPISLMIGEGAGIPRSAVGTYTEYIKARDSNGFLVRGRGVLGVRTGSVDNISVREIKGYHAYQTTTTARPTLSGRYNIINYSQDFTSTNWNKPSTTVSGNVVTRTTTSNNEATIQYTIPAQPAGTPVTFTVRASNPTPGTLLHLRIIGVDGLLPSSLVQFDLSNGTIAYIGTTYAGKCSISPVGDGSFDCTISGIYAASPPAHRVDIGISRDIGLVGGVSGTSITVLRADFRVANDGSSLPPYQRVDDANTYDTNGFPLYLKRDKVDDDLIVQAPAITGSWAHGTIDGPVLGSVAIPAGEYHPFGAYLIGGLETCTQWIAIDGALTAAEQAVLERYVYSKSKLPMGA